MSENIESQSNTNLLSHEDVLNKGILLPFVNITFAYELKKNLPSLDSLPDAVFPFVRKSDFYKGNLYVWVVLVEEEKAFYRNNTDFCCQLLKEALTTFFTTIGDNGDVHYLVKEDCMNNNPIDAIIDMVKYKSLASASNIRYARVISDYVKGQCHLTHRLTLDRGLQFSIRPNSVSILSPGVNWPERGKLTGSAVLFNEPSNTYIATLSYSHTNPFDYIHPQVILQELMQALVAAFPYLGKHNQLTSLDLNSEIARFPSDVKLDPMENKAKSLETYSKALDLCVENLFPTGAITGLLEERDKEQLKAYFIQKWLHEKSDTKPTFGVSDKEEMIPTNTGVGKTVPTFRWNEKISPETITALREGLAALVRI